jgi:sulfur carrier protein
MLVFRCDQELMKISINGEVKQFDSRNMTISALVVTLNLTGKRLAIEKNGEIVPRSQFSEEKLQDGDKLEIVGAVGGG